MGKKYISIFLNILIPLFTIWLIGFLGIRLVVFFLPFVIGWIVAMIANPLVRLLERKLKIVRKHSSAALLVAVLFLVVAGLYLLFSWGARELAGFIKALPELYGSMRSEIANAYRTLSGMLPFLPENAESSLAQVADSFGASIGEMLQTWAALAGGAVARTIPEMFVNTIVTLMSSYLFLAEHDEIQEKVKGFLPKTVRRYLSLLKKDIRSVIGGYFLAQFKIMFVVALVLLIGFLILGVRYSIFLAVGIALLDFLPMFGTGTALIPWAAVKLFTGEYAYAFGLIMIYVLTQAIRQIIQPKIVGDSMGLPPLTTLFFLYIGFKIRGIAGMILAVPVGIILIKFYEYGAFDSLIENVKLLAEEIQKLREHK